MRRSLSWASPAATPLELAGLGGDESQAVSIDGQVVPFVYILVSDALRPSTRTGGDVGAGLRGIAVLLGYGVLAVFTLLGIALAALASRRQPESRAADVAMGMNVITLGGVTLAGLVLFFV